MVAAEAPARFGTPVTVRATAADSVGVFVFPRRPADLNERCFSLRLHIDGVDAVAVPLIDSIYSATGIALATLTALYHEDFHIYQRGRFAPTKDVPDNIALEEPPPIPTEVIESEAFRRLAAEERQILALALRSVRADSIRGLLGRYVQLRQQRLALAPVERSWAEEHNERKEGTAHYVGYKAALVVLNRAADLKELVVSDLINAPAFSNGRGYRNWHIYATGAALCLLLDDLGVNWQNSVVEGRSLFQLAKMSVGQ